MGLRADSLAVGVLCDLGRQVRGYSEASSQQSDEWSLRTASIGIVKVVLRTQSVTLDAHGNTSSCRGQLMRGSDGEYCLRLQYPLVNWRVPGNPLRFFNPFAWLHLRVAVHAPTHLFSPTTKPAPTPASPPGEGGQLFATNFSDKLDTRHVHNKASRTPDRWHTKPTASREVGHCIRAVTIATPATHCPQEKDCQRSPTKDWLHHLGFKLDLRSYLRSTLKTVTPFEFRAGLESEIKFISSRRNWWFEISIRDHQTSSTNEGIEKRGLGIRTRRKGFVGHQRREADTRRQGSHPRLFRTSCSGGRKQFEPCVSGGAGTHANLAVLRIYHDRDSGKREAVFAFDHDAKLYFALVLITTVQFANALSASTIKNGRKLNAGDIQRATPLEPFCSQVPTISDVIGYPRETGLISLSLHNLNDLSENRQGGKGRSQGIDPPPRRGNSVPCTALITAALTCYARHAYLCNQFCDIPGLATSDFCMWESCRTMPLVRGFSRGSPVSPVLLFRRRYVLTSITLIGSEDPDVKSQLRKFSNQCSAAAEDRSGESWNLFRLVADRGTKSIKLAKSSNGTNTVTSQPRRRGSKIPNRHRRWLQKNSVQLATNTEEETVSLGRRLFLSLPKLRAGVVQALVGPLSTQRLRHLYSLQAKREVSIPACTTHTIVYVVSAHCNCNKGGHLCEQRELQTEYCSESCYARLLSVIRPHSLMATARSEGIRREKVEKSLPHIIVHAQSIRPLQTKWLHNCFDAAFRAGIQMFAERAVGSRVVVWREWGNPKDGLRGAHQLERGQDV
ncbi:hypothetical protein PR048_017661 [Dryococelus australis]|uniref:Uncharacterized protein n=1 Tax=Dryococelus australis TaxID=614101 RepID=A0ABQ9HA39_9NEOP|nr:hypothetical protein PR048_017661 [Dryococelus australis]